MHHDAPAPSPLAPGYRLDRYELLCPVASGGMASVWLAKLRAKHGFEKLVAIKTILPQLASDIRFQQMFLDEARLASKIDHANVAHVLDLGDEHGVLYLVMEWVDGDSVSKLQRALSATSTRMPFGVALRIVADACAGLHAAHELCDSEGKPLNVVHRDVSPQNLLIGPRGIVKVIDFGIAKARDRLAGETSTGSLKGKIQFMAPEQAVGRPVDRRADLWSAGAVLYSLLAGEPPYDGPNQFATLHRIASGDPPTPLPSFVPAPVAQIAYRALSFDPDKRFATAAEMQAALEAAMVATGCAATNADVAAFAEQHLSSRVESRKKSVDVALRAAAERDRVERFLKSPDTSTNLQRVTALESEANVASGAKPVGPPYPSTRSQLLTVPDSVAALREEDPLGKSTDTLHASSLPLEEMPALRPRRATVLTVAAAIVAVLVIGVLSLRGATSAPPAPVSASHAPPAITTIPPPPPSPAPARTAGDPAAAAPSAAPAAVASQVASAMRPAEPRLAPSPRKPVATASAAVKPSPRPSPKTERIDDGF